MKIRLFLLGLILLTSLATARAELVRLEISHREPYAAGKSMGDRGPYERLRGRAHFALDPRLEANRSIVDLDLCPLNADGRVEFSADVEILAPVDRAKANGSAMYEVNNRGGKTAVGTFIGGADDFLLRQGFVVVWSGWIAETLPGGERLLMTAPVPTIEGRPLRGIVRQEFIVNSVQERSPVTHRANQGAYRPASNKQPDAKLTRRLHEADPRVEVPRDQWKFIVTEMETNEGHTQIPQVEVELTGGLQPGYIYEVIYEAEGSVVQGVGLAGIRDLLSCLKYDTTEKNPLRTTDGQPLVKRFHGFGTSQSGRCLRQIVYDGFNADEQGRQVFDGIISHVAGGALGFFNHRFAAPTRTNGQHEEHSFPADMFPFTYGDETDPFLEPATTDGILRKARAAKVVPKLMHTQSSSEYWHRSGSLVHTDPLGQRDAKIPDEVRIYAFGGTQHGAGSGLPGARGDGQLPSNPADYRPMMRALFMALDAWVREGREPPPSVYPRIADGTLVSWRQTESGWHTISGVAYPQVIQQPSAWDRGPEWLSKRRITREPPVSRGNYIVRVPAYGPDNNERGCLNLPTLTVPVATYTPWNMRNAKAGAEGELIGLQGGYIPFAKTKAERESTGDPRPALLERYRDFADYQRQLMASAEKLLADGYLLAEDLPRIKALSEKHRPLFEIGELARKLANVKFDHYAPAPGYSEGPTWLNGEVFFCSGALLRVDIEKKVHKHLDLGPAGTVLLGNGHLLICDNKYKALVDLAPDGKVSVVADQFETRPLKSLNDLTVDARGNVYWTDPESSSLQTPVGNVFRARPDGRVDRVATGLAFPNGLDVDPASRYLYVIESQSKKILRYSLPDNDDDLLGKSEVFYDLEGSGGDGCAFDAAGNLWVADFHRPDSGKGRITVLSPKAEVLAYLPMPSKVVSNIAFGGKNHDEIFCTTGDPPGVFHAAVGVKGFAGHPGKTLPTVRTLDLIVRRPHADADVLRQISKLAAEANVTSRRIEDSTRGQIQSLIATLTDATVRGDMEKLLPDLERAAVRHAQDRPLLAEVKRLRGRTTLDIGAPAWLRSIAGDDELTVFGRIAELDLNERTDGHKTPEAKPLKDRVNDDTLKLLVGQDALRRLELSGTAVTSAGLVHLKDLTNLQFLNVCLTAVDDEGLAYLTALTKIRRMTVCASKVTGSGFAHLTGMKQLESINLHSSPASDAGLEAIGKLTSLRRLEIVHTNVTDAGLAHIAGLVNLRQLHIHGHDTTEAALPFVGKLKELYELDIYGPPASNRTLVEVAQLPKLRMLRLFNATLDDEGVKHLSGLATLEELTLNSNKVTDAAIDSLAGLKKLRTINLAGSRITADGRQRLKTLLPKVEIVP